MEFDDVIRRRRSVRRFSDRQLDRDLVDAIVDKARRAPTAGFSQGIDFLVLDDPDSLSDFWSLTEGSEADGEAAEEEAGLARPPVLVVVWSDPERYRERYSASDKIEFGLDDLDSWAVPFWDVDGGMASMQLQLAAVAAGLDTWFFGISDGEAEVRARFGVPADRRQVGVIALGYRSAGEQPPSSVNSRRRRSLEEQLHRNGW
jgi:nitroreductase